MAVGGVGGGGEGVVVEVGGTADDVIIIHWHVPFT